MNILGYPLGLIMRLLYNILHSYGWSLILFTLLVRLVLVPLSIKQQKSSAKMAAIQPQMQEIQKMYAKNQTKMNEELQKLYQREKYNPAGGCLPMLITLLVLFGLIDVIYNPMQHILGISADVITQATEIMKGSRLQPVLPADGHHLLGSGKPRGLCGAGHRFYHHPAVV